MESGMPSGSSVNWWSPKLRACLMNDGMSSPTASAR